MVIIPVVIQTIHKTFTRDDRRYYIFSVTGRDEEFLYYSHMFRPLRTLMFGRNFIGLLQRLMEKEGLCIECGLGLSMTGGVGLDSGDYTAWGCSVDEANRILTSLKARLGDDGQWIELF